MSARRRGTPRAALLALVVNLALAMTAAGTARADETAGPSVFAGLPSLAPREIDEALARFSDEPSVSALQLAAVRQSNLEPERVHSIERRLRASALAPALRINAEGGNGDLYGTSDLEGATRVTVGDKTTWLVGAAASWSLDRLVFNPEEVRLAREAQRISARRERLLSEVTRLYFERRRLQLALSLSPPSASPESLDARLRLEEITALLEGLTGEALSRPQHQRRAPVPPVRRYPSASPSAPPLSAPVDPEQGD